MAVLTFDGRDVFKQKRAALTGLSAVDRATAQGLPGRRRQCCWHDLHQLAGLRGVRPVRARDGVQEGAGQSQGHAVLAVGAPVISSTGRYEVRDWLFLGEIGRTWRSG